MRQYLIDQYFARGLDVRVDVSGKSNRKSRRRSRGHRRGQVARIRQINVVGNERFSDKELLAGMGLKAHNLLSFYRGDDRYSREGSRRPGKLRSYYMDRGYATSKSPTQVALARRTISSSR